MLEPPRNSAEAPAGNSSNKAVLCQSFVPHQLEKKGNQLQEKLNSYRRSYSVREEV